MTTDAVFEMGYRECVIFSGSQELISSSSSSRGPDKSNGFIGKSQTSVGRSLCKRV